MNDIVTRIDWDKGSGLVPAIVQSNVTSRVLMLGYMNADALAQTIETGRVTFFSRTRRKLWTKGESSGNWLELRAIDLDCDSDTLLVTARPAGPTCHTGKSSCFDNDCVRSGFGFVGELERIIDERWSNASEGSYTSRLMREGPQRIAQKVGEEGVELALAAVIGDEQEVVAEAADLLYHLLVLLNQRALSMADIATELERRHTV